MSFWLFTRKTLVGLSWGFVLALPVAVSGQTNYYATNGTEYAIVDSLPGDQVWPDVAVNANGGFVVWQDNATDGSGWGLSAQRLDSTLSGTLSPFRVNAEGANDQEFPRVALLKNGGAVFVWQGDQSGPQHIYARFLTPTNTFSTTNDLLVNTITNNFQINPAVAVLNNSNVVMVWASFDEAGPNSLLDVFGQMFTPTGQKIGGEFLLNQFAAYNQRTPAIAALADGGFVVAWVSEQQRSTAPGWGTNSTVITAATAPLPSVDIYARLYSSNGVALGSEFLVNQDANPAANPAVAAATDGSFLVAWGAHDMGNPTNSWDIYARSFTNASGGAVVRVNTRIFGDEYLPHVSAIGRDYLVVWTSLGQDGSREGVYGQFVHENASLVGDEFRVNSTTLGQQMQPAVASDGLNQFLTVWTGFTFNTNSFDLFAQRYLNVSALLLPIDNVFVYAPFVLSNAVYQPQLQVSWPPVLGIPVSYYEIYVNGAPTPMAVTTSNAWTMTAANGLTKNSTNSFQVDYVTTDLRRSPLSPSVTGGTWSGYNWGGIPFEWMSLYYGDDFSQWPSANSKLAPNGPTLLQVFLSGGNPLDPGTWLQTVLNRTAQGMFLTWNTQPGFTYQVQITTNFTSWSNVGAPRFAAGTTDSMPVGGSGLGYYRVVLLR